jgi:GTP-binding protein LepA
LLDQIVRQVPHPVGDPEAPARAMIFDSVYDTYRGVVTYVRVVDGNLNPRERILMMSTKATHELLEIGVSSPEPEPSKGLGVGEVGYLITGVKDVRQSRVGDTVTNASKPATTDARGYRDPKPMVFSGLYPIDGSDYPDLREALDKLKLNDAALVYEPETSAALGFGFRCGFLGLAAPGDRARTPGARVRARPHLDPAQRRLFEVTMEDGRSSRSPTRASSRRQDRRGPRAGRPGDHPRAERVHRRDHGAVPVSKRGTLRGMDYLSEDRVEMRYTLPLAEIVFDFFDQLKSRTRGYASLDYEPDGEQVADLVKVDILLQGEQVDAFSAIVHKDRAYAYGVLMASKLQANSSRGSSSRCRSRPPSAARIIARETIRAIRKDVLAKCYGGDISRKRKLLEKQKEGKKRMKMVGRSRCPRKPSSPH